MNLFNIIVTTILSLLSILTLAWITTQILVKALKKNKCFVDIKENKEEIKLFINNKLINTTKLPQNPTKEERFIKLITLIVLHQKAFKIPNENVEFSRTIYNRDRRFIGGKKKLIMHYKVFSINGSVYNKEEAINLYKHGEFKN